MIVEPLTTYSPSSFLTRLPLPATPSGQANETPLGGVVHETIGVLLDVLRSPRWTRTFALVARLQAVARRSPRHQRHRSAVLLEHESHEVASPVGLAHVVALPLEVAEPLGLAYHALTHCYVHRHSLPALWRGKCSISKIGLFVNRGRKLNTKLDLAQLSEIAVGIPNARPRRIPRGLMRRTFGKPRLHLARAAMTPREIRHERQPAALERHHLLRGDLDFSLGERRIQR